MITSVESFCHLANSVATVRSGSGGSTGTSARQASPRPSRPTAQHRTAHPARTGGGPFVGSARCLPPARTGGLERAEHCRGCADAELASRNRPNKSPAGPSLRTPDQPRCLKPAGRRVSIQPLGVQGADTRYHHPRGSPQAQPRRPPLPTRTPPATERLRDRVC